MKNIQCLLIVFVFSVSLSAKEGIYIMQAPQSSYEGLNQYMQVLETSDKQLSISDIRNGNTEAEFKPYSSFRGNLDPELWYWGKITIRNNTANLFNGILILGGKRDADFADIYVVDSSGNKKHIRAGYLVPAKHKDITEKLGAKSPLTLQSGEAKTVYIKIHNTTGFAPDFNVRLDTLHTFNDKVKQRNWLKGMLHGFLWLMMLYNILLFIMGRDRTYLYYALYIFGVAVNFLTESGILLENVLKNYPSVNDYLFVVGTGILSMFYVQFFRSFLDTKKLLPKWDKAHKIVIGIKGAEMVILLAIMLIIYNIPAMIEISNVSNLLLLFYGLAFIYGLWRHSRSRLAYYFTFATFSLVAGTLISLYFLMFDHSLGFDPKYFMNAGTVGELIFFSLGLGYKIRENEMEKRRAQDKLIQQLKDNEALQQKVNRELEEKVQERTREIVQQKEEIQAQSNRLEEINQELEKLSIVASETDNAVMIMDGDGNIEWVNDGLKRMFGYTYEELSSRGRNIFDVLQVTDISEVFNQVKSKGVPVTQELPYIRKDEKKIWVQTTFTPILDEDKNIIKLIAIGSDITKIKEAEHKISRQNKQITDSIHYAKRIQSAILPDFSVIRKNFSDYFIFFEPKDIVSGDFYWFKEIGHYVVLVAADCTGHGVPGAFMSMLSVAYLNDIVDSNKVPRTDKILGELREHIKLSLQQTGAVNETKDGIDISFNVFDKQSKKLYFSGAHSPVYVIQDGNISVYKGDRMPVGISRKEHSFTIQEVQLRKGDSLYLFSDGYVDQFGNDNKEKYKVVRFRKLISQIYNQPMDIQEKKIRETFVNWKGATRQIDDVLVMGIKV